MQDSTIIATTPLDGTSYTDSVNAALGAVASHYYGPTDPASRPDLYQVVPGTTWWDASVTPRLFKVRNAANDGWVTLFDITGAPGAAIQSLLDAKLPLAGGAMTGTLMLNDASPAASQAYVALISRPAAIRFCIQGVATVASRLAQVVIEQNCLATGMELWSDDAPTGANLTVSIVRKRVATGDDSRSGSIVAAANAASVTFGSMMALLKGDRLRLDIAGVGSGTPGGNDLLCSVKLIG